MFIIYQKAQSHTSIVWPVIDCPLATWLYNSHSPHNHWPFCYKCSSHGSKVKVVIMSLEQVVGIVKSMAKKFNSLKADVDLLKQDCGQKNCVADLFQLIFEQIAELIKVKEQVKKKQPSLLAEPRKFRCQNPSRSRDSNRHQHQ